MGTVRIERFDEKFIDQIMDIEKDSFSIPWVRTGFTEELAIPGSFIFLALEGKEENSREVLGYIVFRSLLDELHLLKIAVRKETRKTGIALKLMNKLLETAYLKKGHVIYLEVSAANEAAINLYKKNGFIETGRRYKYYGSEDALNMELILAS